MRRKKWESCIYFQRILDLSANAAKDSNLLQHHMDRIPGEWSWNEVTTKKHSIYKDIVLCICLNQYVFVFRM